MSSKSLPLTLVIQEFLSVHTLHVSHSNSKSLHQNRCRNIEFGQINVAEITCHCWQET